MLFTIKTVWKCLFTPRLIKLHENGPVEKLYEPSTVEKIGDQVIQSLCLIWKLGVYTTPLIAVFLYRRGYFEADGAIALSKYVSLLGSIIAASYLVRAVGRANNPMYQKFIKVLNEAQTELTPSVKQQLANYDFEFFAWPVEFRWADLDRDEIKDRIFLSNISSRSNYLKMGVSLPCHILAYLAMHSFGIRLIYPGSIQLLQNVLAQNLLQGRSKLVEVNSGQRYKLQAKDRNEIDVMFVDKRSSNGNGNTLVICCEGNAGFYEIGIMGTPIASGYSVLGWNHPGFGGSTGTPYPPQELNAMDVVMQFAVKKLGFRVENIILFGWSIGGFSTTWAAMNYPAVKGIILDASFDDLMPLALNQMPAWSESIVRLAIREYVNLNNFEQLSKYPGPVLLIRRTEDEVICTTMGNLATNRGNNLLIKLLRYRFPLIMGEIQQKILAEYLSLNVASAQDEFIEKYEVNESSKSIINNHVSDNSKHVLIRLGEDLNDEVKTRLVLYLARKYMKDYKATHCAPLPSDMFQMPWDINADSDFVFT